MSSVVRHGILVVDDDATVRDSIGLALRAAGYEVSLAENGFDALLQLQTALPTVIISALNRRQMSGFEFLSVVRRRFPHISVIAMSAAYHLGDAALGGVIADVFYPRRQGTTRRFLKAVARLIHASEARAAAHPRESDAVWWWPRVGFYDKSEQRNPSGGNDEVSE